MILRTQFVHIPKEVSSKVFCEGHKSLKQSHGHQRVKGHIHGDVIEIHPSGLTQRDSQQFYKMYMHNSIDIKNGHM
jgi:hypothetical protein